MKKILLFCCKGFETMEFCPFVDVMGWARTDFGEEIYVETCGFQKMVKSAFGITVEMDITLKEIDIQEYDALAIPGGFEEYGFYEEAFDERFLKLISAFHEAGKIVASICVGALPVAKSGILKGRNGTTYHLNGGNRQKQLADFGVNVINEPVVEDDNIITSYCPETAAKVAFRLLGKLAGEDLCDRVKYKMGY